MGVRRRARTAIATWVSGEKTRRKNEGMTAIAGKANH